mmetsp:Transcript_54851/g.174298  ORF Transcript_54851/g.174298 Transcript_54851/m.174298 type:complete len:260 (-) Transcript_54851:124-903(-)
MVHRSPHPGTIEPAEAACSVVNRRGVCIRSGADRLQAPPSEGHTNAPPRGVAALLQGHALAPADDLPLQPLGGPVEDCEAVRHVVREFPPGKVANGVLNVVDGAHSVLGREHAKRHAAEGVFPPPLLILPQALWEIRLGDGPERPLDVCLGAHDSLLAQDLKIREHLSHRGVLGVTPALIEGVDETRLSLLGRRHGVGSTRRGRGEDGAAGRPAGHGSGVLPEATARQVEGRKGGKLGIAKHAPSAAGAAGTRARAGGG